MEPQPVRVTMVKKRLLNGQPCPKCMQAEEMLRARGVWDRIDRVVWAVEGEPQSEGMRLGREHGVANAPFFLVHGADGTLVVPGVLTLLRTHLEPAPARAARNVVPPSAAEIDGLVQELEHRSPPEIVRWALERFGTDCALAFSGAEDVVLIDMAIKSGTPLSVFSLDTGRLHPETYRFLDQVRKHYGIEIELVSPAPAALEPFVRKKGLFSFYEDGHHECCGVRKVEPLKRVLATRRAWMTGQRRDQSPTRSDVPVVQVDAAMTGREGALLKFNPLAAWSSAQTWAYLREHRVPYNALHERGFISIGCEPCTRATHPGQHEREGRWWWEEATQRECGLHVGPSAAIER